MTYEPNMTVTRTEKISGFTCIDNRIIRDENLSATARFAMIHLLSVHEQKWNINEQGLRKVLKIGIKAVKKVIAELVNCGYLFKMQIKDEQTKQFGHNWYWIYESPEKWLFSVHVHEKFQEPPERKTGVLLCRIKLQRLCDNNAPVLSL